MKSTRMFTILVFALGLMVSLPKVSGALEKAQQIIKDSLEKA